MAEAPAPEMTILRSLTFFPEISAPLRSAAPEMIAIARDRVSGLPVEFVTADLFGQQPSRRYDTEYRVVKLFWRPEELAARLAGLGWSADIRRTDDRFLTGTATRGPSPGPA